MHGGSAAQGPGSGTFKTGRYSKYLPARLAERYHEAQGDDELLEMRQEIALLDTRLGDLIARIESGESGGLWAALRTALGDLRKAQALGAAGVGDMRAALLEMQELIQRGATETDVWDEIRSLIEQRRKTVESERKRLVEMQQMITSERAMILLSVIVDIIRKHVPDRAVIAAIATDIGALTSGDAQRPAIRRIS